MPAFADLGPADLKERYPAFADANVDQIAAVMDEARGSVNMTWIEADQKPALLALTAHLLQIELYGTGTTTVGNKQIAVTGPLEEVNIGDVKARFAHQFAGSGGNSGSGGDDGGYATTAYGRRYLALFRRSFPAVMVV